MSTTTESPALSTAAHAVDLLADAIRGLAEVEPTGAQPAELGHLLVRLQALLDAGAGVAARWTAAFAAAGGPEDAGAPTIATWMRRELRLTPADARRRARAAAVLDAFPATREHLHAGAIHARHLDAIADGVHKLGAGVFAGFEDVVLDVARACDADAVRAAVTRLRDTLDPDAADAAHVRALERRDVTVTAVGDGHALGGFLPADTGAILKEVLHSAAKPAGADDARTAGQRRVDGLHELCAAALAHGLPSDRGIRPQLLVTVDADRLQAATAGDPGQGAPPAHLARHGPIPDLLLSRLACDSDLTPVAVDTGGHVLDVGRTRRLATHRQRQAILVRQGGTCHNPGCDRTHLEIHHLIPWSAGGQTNLADLRGYCTRCHHLIHQGLLVTEPNGTGGWTHHTRHGQALHDRRRQASRRTTLFTQDLLTGGLAHAREQHRQRTHCHRLTWNQPPDPVRRT